MDAMDTSSDHPQQQAPAPIQTSASRTSSEVVIEGQEPVPLSPIDRVRTTVEASIDAGLAQAAQAQPSVIVSPDESSINASKTLPLPASSSLLGEEDRPFAKPIRSFTNPNIDAATQEVQQQPRVVEPEQEQQQQQQQRREKENMENQPMIAELPATPLASPDLPSHRNEMSSKHSPQSRSNKPEDSSVLYNLPLTPSAEAFEVANKNVSAGYFEPLFPGTDDSNKAVPPVVEGSRS